MSHGRGHQAHMWLMGGVIALLLLLRSGAGLIAIVVIALVLCGVMLGSVSWLTRRSAHGDSRVSPDNPIGRH